MKQHVAAVTGLSGVGKSTLLRKVGNKLCFQHLQASGLIREARSASGNLLKLDNLRSLNLAENQRLLVEGFATAADRGAQLIVLDAHTVIERDDDLVSIEPGVFASIGINSMIFLREEAGVIVKRRLGDTTRQRPLKTVEELHDIQNRALQHAERICSELKIPISVMNSGDVDAVACLLEPYAVEA